MADRPNHGQADGTPLRRRLHVLEVFGPGLIVMLADTDVGSVVTAAQSGAAFGYRLLLLQFLLIPLLYMAQELTVRLGLYTARGHGELIRAYLPPLCGWLAAAALGISASGALVTEFSGVAAVGELYGVPRLLGVLLAAGGLMVMVLTGSYRRVERIALAVGLFELVFFFVAWAARPNWSTLVSQAIAIPFGNRDLRYLAAANIGAAIMPWMVFYQQAAIARKRLGPAYYAAARADTAIGAIVTQCVTAAVLVACAATIGITAPDASLPGIGAISHALIPFVGQRFGTLLFGAGVLGAAMVAAIVASLGFAWGLAEIAGRRRASEDHPLQSSWSRALYIGCVLFGAVLVAVSPNLIALNVAVQVLNAVMLPLVLGILITLAATRLPAPVRLQGWYFWLVLAVASMTCVLGVWGAVTGLGS
jgi:Mn2+/Fe2+ NRAMP family transporter